MRISRRVGELPPCAVYCCNCVWIKPAAGFVSAASDGLWRCPVPSIGGTELVIILVFAFLLFGPDKLPQMGRTIGRALRQFRETQEKLTNVVQTEVVDPMAAAANAPKKGAAAQDDDASADIDDEDADVAEGEAAPAPRRKETFAERRARLAAEKAQKEAAEAESAGEGAQEPSAAAAAEPAPEAAAVVEPAATEDAASQDEEPAELTTEDLYARRPRRRRAADADEPAATDAAEEGGEQ
ncbi:twin-arginine translocase TatA/TatE family subunit [Collinsella tanakaei]|nr:twin-arginine translocase TatA/TatE family subunit [Collinsella tanakaei]